jgi:hypothetical protein
VRAAPQPEGQPVSKKKRRSRQSAAATPQLSDFQRRLNTIRLIADGRLPAEEAAFLNHFTVEGLRDWMSQVMTASGQDTLSAELQQTLGEPGLTPRKLQSALDGLNLEAIEMKLRPAAAPPEVKVGCTAGPAGAQALVALTLTLGNGI